MSVSIWAEKAGCGAGELGGPATPRERVGGKDLGRVQLTQAPILFARPGGGTCVSSQPAVRAGATPAHPTPPPAAPQQAGAALVREKGSAQWSSPLGPAQGAELRSILRRAHGSLLSQCGHFSHSREPQVLPFRTALYCWDSSPS